MFNENNIITIEIEDKKYSAIAFNSKECELPSFLLQGEKKPGYLYINEKLEPWYWTGFVNYQEKKCLYFDQIDLYPLSLLSSSLRSKAPKLILNLAKALSLCESSFLDLQNGIISAWRIYFTKDDNVLLLPRTLSDIFSSTSTEEIRYNNSTSFIHANILPSFSLIDQMAQLFYYSITAIKPYEYKTIRTNGYNAIDLNLLIQSQNINLDSDFTSKINKILHIKLNKMRDISSNYEPQIALKWFIERFDGFQWDLENRKPTHAKIEDLLENEITKTYITKLVKKEKQIIFWRKRGAVIIISSIIAIFVLSFVGSRIHEALKPPYTAGLDQSGVIKAYYIAQNDLDVQALEASLKRGVKSPISNEITTLFVTRQTRLAYERVNSIINPDSWVDEGMPPIEDKKIIYGVHDVQISQINQNQYLATSVFYSPYSLDQSESEDTSLENTVDGFRCYRFEQKQVFSFEYNEKGWYEITDIKPIEMKYLDTLIVPIYNSNDISYDKTKDNRKTEIIVENKYVGKNFL